MLQGEIFVMGVRWLKMNLAYFFPLLTLFQLVDFLGSLISCCTEKNPLKSAIKDFLNRWLLLTNTKNNLKSRIPKFDLR